MIESDATIAGARLTRWTSDNADNGPVTLVGGTQPRPPPTTDYAARTSTTVHQTIESAVSLTAKSRAVKIYTSRI